MQNVSALYTSIISGDHWFETKLEVRDPNGKPDTASVIATYGESDGLFSIVTEIAMYTETPLIGRVVAGEIDVKMIKPSATFPAMAMLRPWVRACNETQQSEWIPQGVYFVDTREESKTVYGESVLCLHGYDAMLRAEQPYASTNLNWPASMSDIVAEIAQMINVDQDSRNEIANYSLPLPVGYSLREILGYIAQVSGGCWIMTEQGKLRLVRPFDLPDETNLILADAVDILTIGGDAILVKAAAQ